ncbi:MAG TPA: endonuclease/exonuclease/phosphatase family protein [Bacteroides sp.]|nr:endonuclease/exonuclease/phosphatase family protein [Bacteroides sp.]
MKYLKYPLYLVLLLLGIFLFILIYGTLSDYKPDEQTLVSENPDASALDDSTFNIMIWNIGYCGLSEKMDFFYDGGKDVRPDQATSESNLQGVLNYISKFDSCDFYLFQEVDIESKRSYRINQVEAIMDHLSPAHTSFGNNFDVFFNPVPPRAPLGKLHSGLASYSMHIPVSSVRHSFPGNYSWPMGVFMLDRCFLVDRYPLSGGKELLVVNTHNSAYDDGSLRKAQMDYMHEFLTREYEKGNYIIVGGDWNQTPSGFKPDFKFDIFDMIQISYLKRDYLPEEWIWLYDPTVPTNRRVNFPFVSGESRTTVIDYYLLSPNLEAIAVKGVYMGFIYSDHQPVLASFRLKSLP